MSDEIELRFAKYLNLSVFESYLRDDQTNRNISNVILSDYNSTLTKDLFEEIRKDTESQSCDNRSSQLIESSNHNIFLFYQLFIVLMLISYATEQSRNMMQAVKHGVADYDNKILTNKAHYTSIGYLAMNKIKDASKDVWMCDLYFYIKDDESIQLQGYVENEVNLNKESSCSGSCEDYKYARNRHCAPGTFCGDQSVNGSKSHICTGAVVDCMFIEIKKWNNVLCLIGVVSLNSCVRVTMSIHRFKIESALLEQIRSKKKIIDVRPAYKGTEIVNENDIIVFMCGNSEVKCRVIHKTPYKSLGFCLSDVNVESVLPGVTKDDGGNNRGLFGLSRQSNSFRRGSLATLDDSDDNGGQSSRSINAQLSLGIESDTRS
ncbi:hypothetical protein HA402_011630 [Bradysia odoriphaga]|nr:hypothetical protein HA402_011630 [Bradysia odoriphaga]